MLENTEAFRKASEVVIENELLLLRTLCFDLQVAHPFMPLVLLLKKLNGMGLVLSLYMHTIFLFPNQFSDIDERFQLMMKIPRLLGTSCPTLTERICLCDCALRLFLLGFSY